MAIFVVIMMMAGDDTTGYYTHCACVQVTISEPSLTAPILYDPLEGGLYMYVSVVGFNWRETILSVYN